MTPKSNPWRFAGLIALQGFSAFIIVTTGVRLMAVGQTPGFLSLLTVFGLSCALWSLAGMQIESDRLSRKIDELRGFIEVMNVDKAEHKE